MHFNGLSAATPEDLTVAKEKHSKCVGKDGNIISLQCEYWLGTLHNELYTLIWHRAGMFETVSLTQAITLENLQPSDPVHLSFDPVTYSLMISAESLEQNGDMYRCEVQVR